MQFVGEAYRRAQAALKTLCREWPQRAAEFRRHDAEFTSVAFWRRHLHLDEAAANAEVPSEIPVPEPTTEEASVSTLAFVPR